VTCISLNLRHIHDLVLLSIKVEVIRFINCFLWATGTACTAYCGQRSVGSSIMTLVLVGVNETEQTLHMEYMI